MFVRARIVEQQILLCTDFHQIVGIDVKELTGIGSDAAPRIRAPAPAFLHFQIVANLDTGKGTRAFIDGIILISLADSHIEYERNRGAILEYHLFQVVRNLLPGEGILPRLWQACIRLNRNGTVVEVGIIGLYLESNGTILSTSKNTFIIYNKETCHLRYFLTANNNLEIKGIRLCRASLS